MEFYRLDPLEKDKTICFYTPVSWPFMYKKFVKSLLNILNLKNLSTLRKYGVTDYFVLIMDSFPVCRNRNEAVLKALKTGADYILFLDADMIHPPDIAGRLLSHNLPIVSGIYFHQAPPNLPVIYNETKDKKLYKHFVNYPKDKLFSVDLTGMGCMLVDTRVFSKIDLPYFAYGSSSGTGVVDITEDVVFCEKVRKAGFDIVIDPTVKCRHIYVGDVGEDIFDAFMRKYKTYSEILEKFGPEIEGDMFDADKL